MMSLEHCRVNWCQVEQPHGRHEQVLGTWLGKTVALEQSRTVQLIVWGHDEYDVSPALTLIDPVTLRQWSVTLSWQDAVQLAVQVELAAGRFREG